MVDGRSFRSQLVPAACAASVASAAVGADAVEVVAFVQEI